MMTENSFGARARITVGDRSYEVFRLDALASRADVSRLPYSLRILLENLLRTEDGVNVRAEDVEALANWDPTAQPDREILFLPARVLMQDFTGVPALVDLAGMRDAMAALGGDPARVNPLLPADLVVDHSIIADVAGVPNAFLRNAEIEFRRNRERYAFLRWGQEAFDGLRVVPPNTGIVHQVNLEYLAQVVFTDGAGRAYPDTLVGTDSHTPMVNGLGVLGWGVGGIEAEAAMLGQPVSMLIPQVVGFKLAGELPEGATATDLVLTVTEMLRRHGVVGKFVEFYGPGMANVPLANRATIGNMSPEYGSTVSIFPIDEETLRYLEFTGRPAEQVALVEAYAKEQGLFHDPAVEPVFSETLELDLSTVVPSLAGPTRPQDRVSLDEAKRSFREALPRFGPEPPAAEREDDWPLGFANGSLDESVAETFPASDPVAGGTGTDTDGTPHRVDDGRKPMPQRASVSVPVTLSDDTRLELDHGDVVIAAITSCTNTSNPHVMLAAALLAKKAVERGLESKPWVKTSLAPGSQVVMDYYDRAGLTPYLEKLRFHLVGFGCTTCIGNSGPLAPEISAAVEEHDLAVVSVLSGNRNFEGRINPDCKLNYLASPPLVVAYALAGSMDVDLLDDPLGHAPDGEPIYLRDIWPTSAEVDAAVHDSVQSEMFTSRYADVFTGDEHWQGLDVPSGETFVWDESSTYIAQPPFFAEIPEQPAAVQDVSGARVLALLGDSVTTDHISPAGAIKKNSPAGQYLIDRGVSPADFNSFGSRRGNHEVMIRGTFGNIRLRNRLAPGTEGGVTLYLHDHGSPEEMSIYEAAQRYAAEQVPLVILAGKEYGSGSSRDWAAKGTALLGVRAVLAESYERIHRSNLIGMGVLPLQFAEGDSVESLGLIGHETFDVIGLAGHDENLPDWVIVRASEKEFRARVRIDTPREADYYRHGGILPYVLRQLRDSA
jgi:aconitate hydratase